MIILFDEKKIILIKVTSSIGKGMLHNAEVHTLYYFCKWISKDHTIFISGIEKRSTLSRDLEKFGVRIINPRIKYLDLIFLKGLFHIPVAIINTCFDTFLIKPDLLFSLGGVFYNGISIVIAGKWFSIPTLVRSAEEHNKLVLYEKKYSFNRIYAIIRSFLSRIAITNSNYFLTVGKWSLDYFRSTYNLSKNSSFAIPGPVDLKFQKLNNKVQANFILNKNNSNKGNKSLTRTILFVGTKVYKGTNQAFELCELIKNENLNLNIIWIGNEEIKKKIHHLGYQKFVNVIQPLNREKLLKLLQEVDFLFWSSPLGVGYGQIIIECLLCGIEVLCYKPCGDVKSFVGNNFYSSMFEVLERLKNIKDEKKINFPINMKEDILDKKHRELISFLLK